MEAEFHALKKWTFCGTVLNLISAAAALICAILCFAFSGSLQQLISSSAAELDNIDPDSVTAGYETLFHLTAAGGFGVFYIAALALVFLLLLYFIPSLAAGILGLVWSREYRSEYTVEISGKGNVTARIILNALLVIVLACMTAGAPSLFFAVLLAYQLLILWSHIRCFHLIRKIQMGNPYE